MTDGASIPFTKDQIEFLRTWMRPSPRNRSRFPRHHPTGTRARSTSIRPREDLNSSKKANLHRLTVATDDEAHLILTNYYWHSQSHILAHICTPYTHAAAHMTWRSPPHPAASTNCASKESVHTDSHESNLILTNKQNKVK